MSTIKHRQEKIQARRKTTPWRQFLMEIGSWYFLTLHKRSGHVCRYPDTSRRNNAISREEYKKLGEIPTYEYNGDSFLRNLEDFFFQFPKEDRLFFYGGNENIEYTDGTFGAKNAYLSYEVGMGSENVCYSNIVFDNCKDVFSSQSITDNCSIIYLSAYVTKSYKVFYSRYIHNCNNIYFSTNLIGCSDCIECHNLENASYCHKNRQLEKDEYLKVKRETLSRTSDFEDIYKKVKAVRGNCMMVNKSSGSALFNTQDVNQSHYVSNLKHGRNVVLFQGLENSSNIYDSFHACGPNSHHLYCVTHTGEDVEHIYCSTQTGRSNNIYYSFNIESCSYCLGCTGLKNKSFCIFNKQYTKEERHTKVDEVFSQMEKDGTLGEFFPGSMNPFYFNDTAAYLIDDSFTKEEVEAAGYLRRDEEIKVDIPDWMDVVEVNDLDQYEGFDNEGNRTIDPAILKKVIRDEEGNSYRVIKMEYDFLVKHGLPLPRKHRLQRLKGHFTINKSSNV